MMTARPDTGRRTRQRSAGGSGPGPQNARRSGPDSTSQAVQVIDQDAPIFVISVAAKLSGMHPQTLRSYDRMGLVQPRRTSGRGRRYSPRDVARLRLIQTLSKEEGVNLEGIRRILELTEELELLRGHVSELTETLRRTQQLASNPRVFAADGSGGVRMTSAQRRSAARAPRALGR